MENNIIFESGDAIFHENKFPFKSRNSRGQIIFENILSMPSSSTPSQVFQEKENFQIQRRRSKRARVEKDFGPDYYLYNVEEIPLTVQEALSSPDAIF